MTVQGRAVEIRQWNDTSANKSQVVETVVKSTLLKFLLGLTISRSLVAEEVF